MNTAGVMPTGFAFPFVEFIQSFANLFASDDAEGDEKGKDDALVDDLDDDDDDDSLFGKDDDKDDKKDDDDDDSKEKPKKDSAIVQKQKYRDLYKNTTAELEKAKARLEELEKKGDTSADPAKAKQEKEARDYLRGLIEEVLGERESKDERAQRELDEQLAEILEDNDDLTEKQVLEVVEELGVTPKQAVAAIRREEKASGTGKKAKPVVPRSKRGSDGSLESDKGEKDKKPMTLEQASEKAKQQLRAMNARN